MTSDQIRQIVDRLLAPLRNRIGNLVVRATVKTVDDSMKMQELQVATGAGVDDALVLHDDVERFQDYGFSSVPKEGAEGVFISLGGRGNLNLLVGVGDRRYRITGLQNGEVAVYDCTGSSIALKASGDIQVTPSSGTLKVTGDLQVSGTVTGTTDVVGGGKSLKSHVHPATGTPPLTAPSGGGPVTGDTGAPV